MQVQQKFVYKIVFTHLIKSSTIAVLKSVTKLSRPLLPCFLHSFPLFSFQGAFEGCTLKIEQCKRKGLTLGMLHETYGLVRSP